MIRCRLRAFLFFFSYLLSTRGPFLWIHLVNHLVHSHALINLARTDDDEKEEKEKEKKKELMEEEGEEEELTFLNSLNPSFSFFSLVMFRLISKKKSSDSIHTSI